MTAVMLLDLQLPRACPLCIKVFVLDLTLSECLSAGLEDFKEELIHIDFVRQTKLWVMIPSRVSI